MCVSMWIFYVCSVCVLCVHIWCFCFACILGVLCAWGLMTKDSTHFGLSTIDTACHVMPSRSNAKMIFRPIIIYYYFFGVMIVFWVWCLNTENMNSQLFSLVNVIRRWKYLTPSNLHTNMSIWILTINV